MKQAWSGNTKMVDYGPMLTSVGAGWTLGELFPYEQRERRDVNQITDKGLERPTPKKESFFGFRFQP